MMNHRKDQKEDEKTSASATASPPTVDGVQTASKLDETLAFKMKSAAASVAAGASAGDFHETTKESKACTEKEGKSEDPEEEEARLCSLQQRELDKAHCPIDASVEALLPSTTPSDTPRVEDVVQSQIEPLPSSRSPDVRGRNNVAIPGAYSSFPGGSSRRLQPSSASALHSSSMIMVGSSEVCSTSTATTRTLTTASTASTSNTNHIGLVEANPVLDEENPPIIQHAQEETTQCESNAKEENDRKRCRCVVLGIGTTLLVAVAVALGLFFTRASRDTHVAPAPEALQNSTRPTVDAAYAYIQSCLPQYTLDALQDPQSSQSKAFQWMYNDPHVLLYAKERIQQRYALATFYYATNGKTSWHTSRDWLSYELHECQWAVKPGWTQLLNTDDQTSALPPCEEEFYRANNKPSTTSLSHNSTTTPTTGTFRRLWLMQNNMSGSIPDELFWLSNLESIQFYENPNITGTLSTYIGTLSNMKELHLSFLSFTGTIPTELAALTQLTTLSLRGYYVGGRLHGRIPTELGLLTNLQRLGFSMADLTGTFPTELFQLTKLKAWDAAETFLTGTLPTEFGLFTDLMIVLAHNTYLTGTLPSEIGNLQNIFWLNLKAGKFTGAIPSEFGKLGFIQELDLSSNFLVSSLPTEFNQLQRLYGLDLSNNTLTGSLPHFNLSAIKSLRLGLNSFSGPIPSTWGQLSTLELLDLSHNTLSSSIPPELGNLSTALREVYLQDNAITGTLPLELADLHMVEVWNSANCQLSGEVPVEYSLQWPNLTTFNISGNDRLFGSIPTGFCQLNASLLSFDCGHSLCGCASCACSPT